MNTGEKQCVKYIPLAELGEREAKALQVSSGLLLEMKKKGVSVIENKNLMQQLEK